MSRNRKPAKTLRKNTSRMTSDNLQNVITGMGTGRSKRSYNKFSYDSLNGYAELEASYTSNWLSKAIVDYPADDMTREWRSIKCKDADAIRAEEDRLLVPHKVNDALTWGRLYGGAAILMMTNQDFEKPLDPRKIGVGGLERLLVLDRYQMYPTLLNTFDIMAENYLEPEFWSLYQGSQRIHHSHFVFFKGTKLPQRLRMQTLGWGDSELRKCMEELKDALAAKGGIAELMQEANIDVISADDLADKLTTGQEKAVTERYSQYGLMKSIFKLSLLDSGEKLDRMTLNLSGVAPALEELKSWVIGASGIPETRLFGSQAKGLGNEGQGDLNNYYDNIRAKQNTQLDPSMHRLDEVLVRSAVGSIPSDYNYDWNRLYQPNRKEEAEAQKIEAETSVILLDAGVIKRSQVMSNLEASEQYHYPDGVIKRLEADELSTWDDEDLDDIAGQESGRVGYNDAAPAPLYVRRDVVNSSDLIKWARSQGFASVIDGKDLHVTIAYSKEPVSWMAVGNDFTGQDGSLRIPPGGPRIMEKFGEGAIVLTFSSSELQWRHQSIRDAGASWDWPNYQPHITITYEGAGLDIAAIEPYQGPIELGPEVFEALGTDWKAKVQEE